MFYLSPQQSTKLSLFPRHAGRELHEEIGELLVQTPRRSASTPHIRQCSLLPIDGRDTSSGKWVFLFLCANQAVPALHPVSNTSPTLPLFFCVSSGRTLPVRLDIRVRYFVVRGCKTFVGQVYMCYHMTWRSGSSTRRTGLSVLCLHTAWSAMEPTTFVCTLYACCLAANTLSYSPQKRDLCDPTSKHSTWMSAS